jgi:hypothetical protein
VVNPVFSNSFITFFTFVGIGVAMTLHTSSEGSEHDGLWDPDLLGLRWRAGSFAAALLFLAALGGVVSIAVQQR